jgi:hypothetical protein
LIRHFFQCWLCKNQGSAQHVSALSIAVVQTSFRALLVNTIVLTTFLSADPFTTAVTTVFLPSIARTADPKTRATAAANDLKKNDLQPVDHCSLVRNWTTAADLCKARDSPELEVPGRGRPIPETPIACDDRGFPFPLRMCSITFLDTTSRP